MSEMVVSKRYADALFQLGQEKGNIEKLTEEFLVVQEVFQNNKELINFLMHPRVGNTAGKKLITEAFSGLQTDVVNTLKLLVDARRTAIIPSVIESFIELVNDAKGIAEATVYSVRKLSDAEIEQLEESFRKRLNKNAINITNVVDSSVIGGVKIRVGNTIYDGSVSGKLRRIEQNLVTANN